AAALARRPARHTPPAGEAQLDSYETDVLNICSMATVRATSDAATKARVLRAATELFAERGFHATKVRDPAVRARASAAAGHYHFGSKRALYVEVRRAAFRAVGALLVRRGVRPDATAVGRMSPRAVAALLERRLLVMLEMLLGPP